MRIYLLLSLLLFTSIVDAQIVLPAYQGVFAGNSAPPVPATLSTTTPSSVDHTSAVCGGNITSAGSSPVTARGVCWSTSSGPTVALSTKTNDGTGTGSFTSNMTDLTSKTLYYVRAYATTAAGTSYGAEQTFSTSTVDIGDTYKGGTVAFLYFSGLPGYDDSVQHGYTITDTDLSTGIFWGTAASSVATSTDGAVNTAAIVAATGTEANAAKLCDDLVSNGYSDWFLPSLQQLLNIYAQNSTLGITGTYWTSTALSSDNSRAYYLNFAGTALAANKANLYKVRAIRVF